MGSQTKKNSECKYEDIYIKLGCKEQASICNGDETWIGLLIG